MIKKNFKKTFSTIKKNKSKVLFIFFLQIIFFLSLSLIFFNTIIPSMEEAKKAMDYYDKINTTEDPKMFGYLGEDPLVVYESYGNVIYYFKFMALYSILAFIIINGLTWMFTDNLINKKNIKQSLNYLFNFSILTILFLLIVYALVFNPLKTSIAKLEYSFLPLTGMSIVLIALIHFLLVSLSLIGKRKPKDIARLTFKIGVVKFPSLIQVCLTNIIIISILAYLIYLTIELNTIILSIITLLFVFSFVFARISLITAVKELTK